MADLQRIGNQALQKAPQPLRRALNGLGVQFREDHDPVEPMAGGLGPDSRGMIAGVEKGRPSTISVMQPDVFTKNADQLATHEGMHSWQNNLPPSIQKAIPADNPADPYNYGGTGRIAKLVKSGGTLLDLPREQQAAAMQYGQVQGMPEPYNALAHTMDKIPLSQIDMTDPMAKTINMHPRAPQVPPSSVPGMNFAKEIYRPGQPAPGDMPDLGAAPMPNVVYAPTAGHLGSRPDVAPDMPMLDSSSTAPDTGAPKLAKVAYAPSPVQASADSDKAWLAAHNKPSIPGQKRSTWGNIAHVLNVAGNIAGNIVAPGVMANIPGTQFNNELETNLHQGRLNREEQEISENNSRDAGTQATQLANANEPQRAKDAHNLSQSQQGNLDSETYARQHPVAQNEFQLWRQQNPGGTAEQFNQLQSHPLSQQDADSRNAVWDTLADRYHLPKGQFRAGMSGADAAAMATALNNVVGRDQGGQKIIIQGQSAANAAGKTRDTNTEKAYTAASKDLNSQFSAAQTQAETLATAREELHNGAVGQAAGTIKTLVGLAGGKGTGVRITQAELNAIAHARGIQGDFEGFINKLSGQGALSGPQLKQMDDLLSDVEGKIRQKMSVQDKYLDRLAQAGSEQDIRGIQSEYRKEALSGGGSNESNTQQFTVNGKSYNIPANMVEEFKRDHPNAR